MLAWKLAHYAARLTRPPLWSKISQQLLDGNSVLLETIGNYAQNLADFGDPLTSSNANVKLTFVDGLQ